MRKKLLILGASLFAEDVADFVVAHDLHDVAGFVEGIDRDRCEETVSGLPVHWIDDVATFAESHRAVCAVGSPKRERFIAQAAALGLRFTTVVHPTAVLPQSATLGEGSIVGAGVIVAAKTTIGAHVILNRGSLVGHHTQIGDYVTISPGANIAGRIKIGHNSYIGMGAIVLDGLTIGNGVIVGAGAVVTKDVPDRVQVVGIPARVVKTLD